MDASGSQPAEAPTDAELLASDRTEDFGILYDRHASAFGLDVKTGPWFDRFEDTRIGSARDHDVSNLPRLTFAGLQPAKMLPEPDWYDVLVGVC